MRKVLMGVAVAGALGAAGCSVDARDIGATSVVIEAKAANPLPVPLAPFIDIARDGVDFDDPESYDELRDLRGLPAIAAGSPETTVSQTAHGLLPSTAYHYRACGSFVWDAGYKGGCLPEKTFTTAPAPAGTDIVTGRTSGSIVDPSAALLSYLFLVVDAQRGPGDATGSGSLTISHAWGTDLYPGRETAVTCVGVWGKRAVVNTAVEDKVSTFFIEDNGPDGRDVVMAGPGDFPGHSAGPRRDADDCFPLRPGEEGYSDVMDRGGDLVVIDGNPER